MHLMLLIHSLTLFARGGGGGHGGGGGGFGGGGGLSGGGYSGSSSSGGGGIFFFIIFIFVISLLIYKYSQRNSDPIKSSPAEDNFGLVASKGLTKEYVTNTFQAFQRDWSSGDADAMRQYLSNRYHYDVSLMIGAMQIMKRQNSMDAVTLYSAKVLLSGNSLGADVDSLMVEIHAGARDSLIDTVSGDVYYSDTAPFSEYWYFVQEDNVWKLDNIRQTTEFENVLHPAIENFASANNFFYSGEWGNLLLPTRGQLFNQASFTSSAINDHVIGMYKNVIIEFYTYLPNKGQQESYTVAQAVLPRSYGDIIVRHKSGLLNFKPHGLVKVETEWPDFNKKYAVYASNAEQATSLELLNPSFMVRVDELPFELNIEVVDNIVYLYTKQTLEDYDQMLNILYLAFQEMKM
jgi:hypothetical protein